MYWAEERSIDWLLRAHQSARGAAPTAAARARIGSGQG